MLLYSQIRGIAAIVCKLSTTLTGQLDDRWSKLGRGSIEEMAPVVRG